RRRIEQGPCAARAAAGDSYSVDRGTTAPLCPSSCPRRPATDPKRPHLSQRENEKPLGKSLTYRGALLHREPLPGRGQRFDPSSAHQKIAPAIAGLEWSSA